MKSLAVVSKHVCRFFLFQTGGYPNNLLVGQTGMADSYFFKISFSFSL